MFWPSPALLFGQGYQILSFEFDWIWREVSVCEKIDYGKKKITENAEKLRGKGLKILHEDAENYAKVNVCHYNFDSGSGCRDIDINAEVAPWNAQADGVAHIFNVQQWSNTEGGEVAIQVDAIV